MRLLSYAPAAVWAAVVLWIGSRRDVPSPEVDFPLDKVAHFGMYGLLGFLAAWGWRRAGRRPGWGWPLAAALAVGAADELRQRGVEGRSPEVADWVADAAGAALAFGLAARGSRSNSRGSKE